MVSDTQVMHQHVTTYMNNYQYIPSYKQYLTTCITFISAVYCIAEVQFVTHVIWHHIN